MGPEALRFIHSLARKLTAKRGTGVASIPNRMEAEAKASEIAQTFVESGMPLDQFDNFIRSEADVSKYLNMIKSMRSQRGIKAISADSPEGRRITEALFGKKGSVVDMTGKPLDPSKPIIGGTQPKGVGSLMSVDERGPGFAGKEYALKNVDSMIKNINRMDPLDAMKEANKVIKREGPYKNLKDSEAKKILTDTEDHIFGRDVDPDPEDMFAEGGRAGFVGGGMGRRGFLKLLGGLGAGIAGLKSGLFGLGKKEAGKKVVKEIIKTPPAVGKPEWFDALVNKVILEGNDVTKKLATKDREIVHTKKLNDKESVTVTQDLDDGAIRVEYDSPDNMGQEPVMMQFKPGVADETTGGRKPPDRFDAVETEPRFVGGPEDADMEFTGEGGGPGLDYITSDVTNLKTFATGKGPTMKEIVKSQKRKKEIEKINEDNYSAAEYLNGKYGDGPEPDFDDLDNFASGGRVGFIFGGGILKEIIRRAAAKRNMSVRDFVKNMNPKSIPEDLKRYISPEDLQKLKQGQLDYYENMKDMMRTRKDFQDMIKKGKQTPASDLFRMMEKDMDVRSIVPKNVSEKDILTMEQILKNKAIKGGRRLNASGGIAKLLGE